MTVGRDIYIPSTPEKGGREEEWEEEEEEEKRERNVNCLLGWMKTDERATASGDWRRNQYTKN